MRYPVTNQAGFGHVVAVFVLIFVGVVGFAGYSVVNMNKASEPAETNVTAAAEVPDKISSPADLDKTVQVLDDSEKQVGASLNDSSLDADLNDML